MLVVVLAGCGGGGGGETADERVARQWVVDALAGRASAAWDGLHPGVQAGTTREAYIACAAGGGVDGARVSVVESTAGSYTARDGSARPGTQVVVRADAGGRTQRVALWVVDGRIAGAGDDDGGCAPRL